jgi:hypothetical protein
MVIDVGMAGTWEQYKGARVVVDGVEIPGVVYVDTDRGLVKTLCAFFDATDRELARSVYVSPRSGERDCPATRRAKYLQLGWQAETLPARYEIEWHERGGEMPLTRIIRGAVTVAMPYPAAPDVSVNGEPGSPASSAGGL